MRNRGVARRVEVAQRGRRVEEAGEHRSGGALESEAGHEAAGHGGEAAGGTTHLDCFSAFGSGPGLKSSRMVRVRPDEGFGSQQRKLTSVEKPFGELITV